MRGANSIYEPSSCLENLEEDDGSVEDQDEIESISSYQESIARTEVKSSSERLENIRELVESIDLTLVVWLREMYCKYNQPYLTCLDCLEDSNYTTRLAEELLMSKFGAK
ncbi:hypothetical protein HWI79_3234 [Cryptosporidium felis]|nr:hypothetical protein HWI79_3234 [Cryptosporidium felis]